VAAGRSIQRGTRTRTTDLQNAMLRGRLHRVMHNERIAVDEYGVYPYPVNSPISSSRMMRAKMIGLLILYPLSWRTGSTACVYRKPHPS
jgi:hypothetical protein